MNARLLQLCVAALVMSSAASAQLVVPVSQTRSVSALADDCGFSKTQTDQAPGFGPFVSSVNAGGGQSEAFASQDSTVHSSGIAGSGLASMGVDNLCSPGECSESDARSVLTVEFDLTQDAVFCLDGQTGGLPEFGVADLRLRDGGGAVLHAISGDAYSVESIFETGVLPAGRYTLEGEAHSSASICDGEYTVGQAAFSVELSFVPLAVSFCAAGPNSVGAGAVMSYSGSQSIVLDDSVLQTSGLPAGVPGLYFFGPSQVQAPFGDGFRCAGGMTRRLQPPLAASAQGTASRALDLSTPPAAGVIDPMTSWNFQLWYRDPTGPGGSGFNLSDGLAVTFCR